MPWLPTREFVALSGMPLRTFRRKVKSMPTRYDGKNLLISAEALPAAAQAKLLPVSRPAAELKAPEPAHLPAPLFASPAGAPGTGRRIALSAEGERQARERLQIVQPLLDFLSTPADQRQHFQQLRLDNGRYVRTADDMAAYLAETYTSMQQPVSRPTIWRWKARYEADGLPGLARKVRADKGRSTWAQTWPEAATLVAATYLQPFRSKQAAYDALTSSGIIPATQMPDYESVRLWLEKLPRAAVILAREGERAHNERMAPYISRGYEDVLPNQIWVADTMLHDVLVRNDCFGANPGNEAVRLQLTAIIDMRSRKIVGYAWVLNGSSRSITTALRGAVRRFGPPELFYCDNGKDFQKVARNARPANYRDLLTQDFEEIERSGALRQLGVAVQYCMKYHPQSKHIERFFGTLHARFDSHFPHYTTGNAYNKPDVTVLAAAEHGRLLRFDRGQESPLVAASHFVAMAKVWIEEEYNAKHRHSGRGMGGRTPDEVFAPALEARRSFDASVLEGLLWTRERRTVRECAVKVAGRRLIGASEFAAAVMYDLNESEVIVCFDANDPSVGSITDLDGHKLCDVRAEHFVSHSSDAGPVIAASMEQRARHLRDTRASIRAVHKTATRMGHKPAIQTLSERALQLAAPMQDLVQPTAKATGTFGANAQPEGNKLSTEDIVARFMKRRAQGGQ